MPMLQSSGYACSLVVYDELEVALNVPSSQCHIKEQICTWTGSLLSL